MVIQRRLSSASWDCTALWQNLLLHQSNNFFQKKRQTYIIFKHRDDCVRKSLVTAKQLWDLQGRSFVQALADVDNIFGVVGIEIVEKRRDNS